MKLPSKVRIGGMTYKVLPMPREMHEGRGDDSIVGLCDKINCTIHIWMHQPVAKVWSTLWHEMCHSKAEESAVDLKGCDEEDLVRHLEVIDWQIFRDNPKMMIDMIKVASGKSNNSSKGLRS